MRYVYADVFFVINFLFDFSLLYLAGRLARATVAGRRLTLAAALGAAYGVGSVYPGLAFLFSLPIKLLFSGLMVAVAYQPQRLRPFLKVLGFFYVSAFGVGGAALAWTFLMGDRVVLPGGALGGSAGPLGLGGVLPAVLFGASLLHWAVTAGREHRQIESLCVPCRVVVWGREVEFPALVDTGNRLRDPLSDAPVVIVEYLALGSILPAEFSTVWAVTGGDRGNGDAVTEGRTPGGGEPDLARLAASLGGSPWSARLRLIPFSSLGRADGLLVGFRPDEVVVGGPGRNVRRTDVVICVSPRPLSAEGGYRALLPLEVLEGESVA